MFDVVHGGLLPAGSMTNMAKYDSRASNGGC